MCVCIPLREIHLDNRRLGESDVVFLQTFTFAVCVCVSAVPIAATRNIHLTDFTICKDLVRHFALFSYQVYEHIF